MRRWRARSAIKIGCEGAGAIKAGESANWARAVSDSEMAPLILPGLTIPLPSKTPIGPASQKGGGFTCNRGEILS